MIRTKRSRNLMHGWQANKQEDGNRHRQFLMTIRNLVQRGVASVNIVTTGFNPLLQ